MVTYDQVKTKCQTLRNQILSDLVMKRYEIAKNVHEKLRSTILSILTDVQNMISYSARFNVHRYNIESYITSRANEIGSKAVSVDYNDTTRTVNGYEVPKFDEFTFDQSNYKDKLKDLTPTLAKQVIKIAIPASEETVTPDCEDAFFKYFFATEVTIYPNFLVADDLGTLQTYAEFGVYGLTLKQYSVVKIEGELIQLLFDIGEATIQVWYIPTGSIELLDVDTNQSFRMNIGMYCDCHNPSDHQVYVCVYDSKLSVSPNHLVRYIQFADIKLMPTPVKIKDISL